MFRIFPSVPITWRSAACVQFGVDDPVLVDGLLPADVALLDDIRLGIGSAQFYTRAQALGVDLARAGSLISLLAEAGVMIPENSDSNAVNKDSRQLATAQIFHMAPDHASRTLAARPVMVLGPARAIIEGYLSASGFTIADGTRVEHLDLFAAPIVITTSYLVPDIHSATWLIDREVSYLEVVLGEYSVEISGLVRPGTTPCTVCTCLQKRDADEQWLDQYPRIRALPDREELCDPLARGIGAIHAVQLLRRAVLCADTPPVQRRVSVETGACEDMDLSFHHRCHCRVAVPQLDLLGEQAQ